MKFRATSNSKSLVGKISVVADKSIAHRAIMFNSLAKGKSRVRAIALGRDNFSTARVMIQLGAKISGSLPTPLLNIAREEGLADFVAAADECCELIIESPGIENFRQPAESLYCGNSGTTARLLTGVLAGCRFKAELSGDASLSRRPFRRVTEPLSAMGAHFSGEKLPLEISGGNLNGLTYESPKASAQVKSAILLAGLSAEGITTVSEPTQSRDHTERLLSAMGIKLSESRRADGRWQVSLLQGRQISALQPVDVDVPGDFSAAAFFLVAGSIVPNSEILVKSVCVNKTRVGLFSVLKRMGACVQIENERMEGGEVVGDISVKASKLRGVVVSAEDVVLAIDEVPALCVAAACAEGVTKITGAEELRVKESDRLAMMAKVLGDFGVKVKEYADGLEIVGNPNLGTVGTGSVKRSWGGSGDHRIEMSGAILEYLVGGYFEIADSHAVETSFPTFVECFQCLAG